jgi:phage baseplate assembly protein W
MTRGYSPKFPLSFSSEGGYALNRSVIEVVKQNFKNLLLTNPGERIFDINFGIGLKKFLFEQKTEETNQIIKNRIYSQTSEYLPFIEIQEINIVNDSEQENTIYVKINYFIRNISTFDVINLNVKQ